MSLFRNPAVALHSTPEELPLRPYLIWSSSNLSDLTDCIPSFTLLQPPLLSCCSFEQDSPASALGPLCWLFLSLPLDSRVANSHHCQILLLLSLSQ